MPSNLDLAAIKAACEGHTPGDWKADDYLEGFYDRVTAPTGAIAHIPFDDHIEPSERIANAALIAAAPALLAECEYQAQAIEELVATVDDMIVQRNKAEAENERLTADRDRLRGLLLRVTNLCSQFKFDAEEWQTVKDARATLAERDGNGEGGEV